MFHPGQSNEVRALDDVDLTLRRGEHVVIVGSNGAGKSTLLNVVCGRFIPDHGAVLLDGHDITELSEPRRARRIGRFFQDPTAGTAAPMSIAENLALAGSRARRRRFRSTGGQQRAAYREQLSRLGMGLEDRLDVVVGGLSGGQRQALALLMAAISQPELLVLDEHTAALDPAAAHRVLELTNDLVGELSLTTLMVTHNMQHAVDTGERTVMMHRGAIMFDVRDEERSRLTVAGLVERFHELRADVSDRSALVW
jgi:putative ABC transport system ATP-binding protein